MITRKDTEFPIEGGIYLRGWLFVPEGNQEEPPSIAMARAGAAHWARPGRANALAADGCLDVRVKLRGW
jgi:hypothetical protein